ncbi:MAG: MBL fold metallo-hydrolase [Chloroflexi bacterium]|nr:MBL fold metallo-hydrolase [Chloroflexota bacterium]MBI4315066.1 MBL fold metallo-hydrolase [Chloroflexota bacterium]MBI5293165.1 MBL fold metallo-hydrolase [Chloroflexota bacterium]MBI5829389.1 MBL fold metallo-hydrolase [Chloroflexota bacterium]
MEITWYGHSCFRLTERGLATIVTDPYNDSIGYDVPRLKADIVTVSHEAPGHNNVEAVKGARLITSPGEYEIGGVFITGIPTQRPGDRKKKDEANGKNTLYLFDFDGLTVAHLGDLDHVPTQAQIEDLGAVTVALVPVGGGGGLNAAQAAEVISLIEPYIVVPMHYKTPDTKLKLDPLSKFLKEMGLSTVKTEESLTVKKGSLPEETHVAVLEYKRG